MTLKSDRTISKQAVLQLLGDRVIAYHKILAHVLGGVEVAVFVSQLLYWTGKEKSPDGWIFKKQREFEEETGLTRHNQETARARLKSLLVLEERLAGTPATLHFRLDLDRLAELLDAGVSTKVFPDAPRDGKGQFAKSVSLPQDGELDCRDTANLIAAGRQTIPESTAQDYPESTTAATAAILKPPLKSGPEEPRYGPAISTYDPDESDTATSKPRQKTARVTTNMSPTTPLARQMFARLNYELHEQGIPPAKKWRTAARRDEWLDMEQGIKTQAQRERIDELVQAGIGAGIRAVDKLSRYVAKSWHDNGMNRPAFANGAKKPDAVEDMRRFAEAQGWGADFIDKALTAGAVTEADFARLDAIDAECVVLPG